MSGITTAMNGTMTAATAIWTAATVTMIGVTATVSAPEALTTGSATSRTTENVVTMIGKGATMTEATVQMARIGRVSPPAKTVCPICLPCPLSALGPAGSRS